MKLFIHSMLKLTLVGVFIVGFGLSGCAKSAPLTPEKQVQLNVADLRETLSKTVADANRLQQMMTIVERMETGLQADALEVARLRDEQVRLNRDYNATRAMFELLGNRVESARKSARDKAIAARTELAQLATDAEWKKITARDLAILGN